MASLVSLALVVALQARSIHECRDPAGRLIYQDQPCRGELREADAPPVVVPWEEQSSPCQLRSPLIGLRLLPLVSRQPEPVRLPPPGEFDPEIEPEVLDVSVWLELNGSADGVALRIRGFEPLPETGLSFDPDINGQGIRSEHGVLVEVDSMDGPGSLRYGFSKSSRLMSGLGGASAQLEVRVRGYQAQPATFELQPVLTAIESLQSCGGPVRSRGQRRLPGK